MFCKKCGNILHLKRSGKKTIMVCDCGYKQNEKSNLIIKEKVELTREEKVEVVDKEKKTDPITESECPECGYKKAYYWLMQTRAADEGETRFLKCVKCDHIWREYS